MSRRCNHRSLLRQSVRHSWNSTTTMHVWYQWIGMFCRRFEHLHLSWSGWLQIWYCKFGIDIRKSAFLLAKLRVLRIIKAQCVDGNSGGHGDIERIFAAEHWQ